MNDRHNNIENSDEVTLLTGGPNIRNGQVRVLSLHGMQHVAHDGESGIGSVAGFGLEAHGSAVTASCVGILAVCTRSMLQQEVNNSKV